MSADSAKIAGKRVSAKQSVLLAVLFSFALSGCQIFDQDQDISEKGAELIKQRRFAEAEALFQADILKQENKLISLKALGTRAKQPLASLQRRNEKMQAKRLAVAYQNLGTALYESGKYGTAEAAFEKAVEAYRPYFGKQNTFVVNCYNLLAASYYKQGKLLEAERYYSDELILEKALFKPDNLSLAVTSNNLAAIYQKLGDDVNAEKYFHWALNLCLTSKESDKESDQLVDILNNLALFYEKQDSHLEAKRMVQKAIDTEDKRSGGKFSANKVRSLVVLSGINKATLDLDAAESNLQEALTLLDSAPTPRPDLACEVLEKYADLLFSQRKFKEAEPQFVRSVKACEEAYGLEHPSVAERLSEFSLLYRRTGRFTESESMLRRALAIQEKTIGVGTSAFLTTVHRLASLLAEQNRYKEADELYQQILPKLKERIGPDHPFVADTIDNWATYVEPARGKEDADELRSTARTMRRNIARSLTPVYEKDSTPPPK